MRAQDACRIMIEQTEIKEWMYDAFKNDFPKEHHVCYMCEEEINSHRDVHAFEEGM